MAKRKALALLPPAKDLKELSPEKIQIVIGAIDRDGDRELAYATLSMKSGVVCLLGSLAVFTFLVMNGHDKAAGIVVGGTVAGLIGKIVLARLS